MRPRGSNDLRLLRSELRHCQAQLAGVEQVLDQLNIDTHTQGGARYPTLGRVRRLGREVGRLRHVERVAEAARRDG